MIYYIYIEFILKALKKAIVESLSLCAQYRVNTICNITACFAIIAVL